MTLFSTIRIAALLPLLFATACTGPDEAENDGPLGKGDSPEQRCESAVIDTSGFCRASDGTFAPAECCVPSEEFETFVCSVGDVVFSIDNSEELEQAVSDEITYDKNGYSSASELVRRQIYFSAIHLGFLTEEDATSELFDSLVSDEEDYTVKRISVEGSQFDGDWVQFYAGDTEVGVVYERGTLNLVAEVGDGDIRACSPKEPIPAISCTFDTPIFGVEESSVLQDSVTSSMTVNLNDALSVGLSQTVRDQIRRAAEHLRGFDFSASVFDLYSRSYTDDEEYIYNTVVVDSKVEFSGDWVKFYAGGNEVGVVFESGTTTIVAEVSDGDLMECTSE